jgi:hypothetical protein
MGGKPRTGAHGVHTNWQRTGGFIGDDSMSEMDAYNQSGAGVDESQIKSVGAEQDPNSDVGLGRRLPGSED